MVCKYHLLLLQLGVGTNYLAEFRERISFSDKATLLEHVLDKAETAGLVIIIPDQSEANILLTLGYFVR